jgi:hypothetical protein
VCNCGWNLQVYLHTCFLLEKYETTSMLNQDSNNSTIYSVNSMEQHSCHQKREAHSTNHSLTKDNDSSYYAPLPS